MKFTPGPWFLTSDSSEVYGNGASICRVKPGMFSGIHCQTPEISEFNGALIASAPDLYTALDGLISMLENWDSGFTVPGEEFEDVIKAREALKKARGK